MHTIPLKWLTLCVTFTLTGFAITAQQPTDNTAPVSAFDFLERAFTAAPYKSSGTEMSLPVYFNPHNSGNFMIFPTMEVENRIGYRNIRVVGTTVLVDFRVWPAETGINDILAHLTSRVSPKSEIDYKGLVPVTKGSLLMVPLTSIRVQSLSATIKGGTSWEFSEPTGDLALTSEVITAHFPFADHDAAMAFKKSLDDGRESFKIQLFAIGRASKQATASVTYSELESRDFGDSAKPIDHERQLFSLSQISKALQSKSGALKVSLEIDGGMVPKYQELAERMLDDFVAKCTMSVEFDAKASDDLWYIGLKSFTPTRTLKEQEELTTKLQTELDNLTERLYDSENMSDVENQFRSSSDNLEHIISQMTLSGKVSGLSGLLGSGATNNSLNIDYLRHNKQQKEALTRTIWVAKVKEALKTRVYEKINKEESRKYTFEGEKYEPRRINAYRLVTKNGRVDSNASFTVKYFDKASVRPKTSLIRCPPEVPFDAIATLLRRQEEQISEMTDQISLLKAYKGHEIERGCYTVRGGRIVSLLASDIHHRTGRDLDDEAMKSIRNLKGLESLSLSGSDKVTEIGVAELIGNTSLRRLGFGTGTAKQLHHVINQLKELENLSLWHSPVDDTFFEGIQNHPSIKEVSVAGRGLTLMGMSHLKKMPKLERVRIHSESVGFDEASLAKFHSAPDVRFHSIWRFESPPKSGIIYETQYPKK